MDRIIPLLQAGDQDLIFVFKRRGRIKVSRGGRNKVEIKSKPVSLRSLRRRDSIQGWRTFEFRESSCMECSNIDRAGPGDT